MFVANPTDPALTQIRYVASAGPSNPVAPRSAAYRTERGKLLTFAGVVLAAAVVGFGAGTQVGAGASTKAQGPTAISVDPMPGEFRLAPGNQQPLGVVVPIKSIDTDPMPGEFRLAPGNQQPLGVTRPSTPAEISVDPKPGEFRLSPGNLQPVGAAAR